MNNYTKSAISTGIFSLGKSESNVQTKVSFVSRGLLDYLVNQDSCDIGMANRFIDSLTPANRKVAIKFLQEFLPYQWLGNRKENPVEAFGKKMKKGYDDKCKAAIAFLRNEDADLWTWAAVNVKIEKRAPDYVKQVESNVAKALKAEVSAADIINAVLAGGVSTEDMLAIMAELADSADAIAA